MIFPRFGYNNLMKAKTREGIVEDWLPRYTGMSLEKFGAFVLLTNFFDYLVSDRKAANCVCGNDLRSSTESKFIIVSWQKPLCTSVNSDIILSIIMN